MHTAVQAHLWHAAVSECKMWTLGTSAMPVLLFGCKPIGPVQNLNPEMSGDVYSSKEEPR